MAAPMKNMFLPKSIDIFRHGHRYFIRNFSKSSQNTKSILKHRWFQNETAQTTTLRHYSRNDVCLSWKNHMSMKTNLSPVAQSNNFGCLTNISFERRKQDSQSHAREFSSDKPPSIGPEELKRSMEDLSDKFAEARELLEDLREVKGTLYYNDDQKEAFEAVSDTLKSYAQLLEKLNDTQKQEVMRTIGLKMEELKAHKKMIETEE